MKFIPILFLFFLVACSDPATSQSIASSTTEPPANVTPLAPPTVTPPSVTPLSDAEALPPVALQIPAIKLNSAVVPMAWGVTVVNGQRRAEWQLPEAEAGWHVNSAGAGAAKTVIISGHHRAGARIFAPIAQGGVQKGQEIWLTDKAGRVWLYTVREISQPIPVNGASKAEQEQLQAYLAAGDEPRLVLLTGWPEFSDTHYLAVVAELTGRQ